MKQIVECVPNFSEGRDKSVIDRIVAAIASVEGVKVLDVDPGEATNRTVVTFVGEPAPVCEAAFRGAAKAQELIDMRHHHGAHPRSGATDVLPLIPVAGITLEECASLARKLAKRLYDELGIPCYYCTGYSGEDHAWNIIRIGDTYYNVDVTWDDTDPSTYDYFNKTDAQFVGTHVRTGMSVYLPPCGSLDAETVISEPAGDSNVVAGITLNPNPQQPLTWTPKEQEKEKNSVSFVSGGDVYSLEKAGLSEDAVQTTLQAYYQNCLKQMTDRGAGQQSFSNVVPKYVLTEIEKAYGTGDYEAGYVKEGLQKLERDHFAIQIQVQELGGNYYRLYHNIYTW